MTHGEPAVSEKAENTVLQLLVLLALVVGCCLYITVSKQP